VQSWQLHSANHCAGSGFLSTPPSCLVHLRCLLQVKPGCILRRSNFNVLEREQLVTGKQVDQCKKRMNTFGFVGDL
jgi:hypothetical protein